MMNLRCPPSSALSCMTAWAVVAEPEKKSRIKSPSSVDVEIKYLIKTVGLGKLNARFRAQIFLFHILVNQQFPKLLVAHSHSSIPPDEKSALLLGRTPLCKAAKSNNGASQRCILLYQNRMENARK